MKYLFAKIYFPLMHTLMFILWVLILVAILSYGFGYREDAFKAIDYIVIVSALLLIFRVADHFYVLKAIKDQKKRKEMDK